VGKAEDYRKRADALDRTKKRRRKIAQKPMARKQKALRDMADNEDWLEGKLGTGIRQEKK
jgi:ATP-dependent protease ClpP protease subunit